MGRSTGLHAADFKDFPWEPMTKQLSGQCGSHTLPGPQVDQALSPCGQHWQLAYGCFCLPRHTMTVRDHSLATPVNPAHLSGLNAQG